MNSPKNISEIITKAFQTNLGQQCTELFTTSDGRVFIRLEEAIKHRDGLLDKNTMPLVDKKILEWFEEWSGSDKEPQVRSIELTI